ncbi:MAG TPA: hypothetical protein VEC39_05140, partial [Vicinamibacterales bacterium]|nr:hypothetical protein [Vicinamibacterales bacterium]
PARSYFMPVMNVMTPVFLLVPLCLLEVYLRTRRTWLLAAAGAASYWLILFEPLPLIAAPIALAQVVRRVRARHIATTDAVRALVYPVLIVTAIHLAMRLLVGFDTVAAFLTAWEDARRFNAANERPYGLWAFHNVKDALLHAGVGQAALFLIGLALLPRRRSGFDGVAWLIATLAFVFVMLAVLGINRGETVRLWIFLGVLLQIAAASICASRPRLGDAVLALAVVQVGLLLPAVGWVMLD